MNTSKVVSRLLIPKSNIGIVPFKRNIRTSRVLRDEHEPYRDIGYNLPFSIDNPYGLWVKFCFFFGSGFWYPFFAYHYNRVNNLNR